MNLESSASTKKTKQQVLEEFNSGTPLKYALEIANVTNAEELLEKLSQFETNAGFEKVFAKLKAVRDLKDIKIAFKSLDYLGDLKDGALYNTQGQYKNSTNTITIDYTYANVGNVSDFYVTVLHELFHHVFRGADIASGINILYGISDVKNTIEKLPVHNKYRHLYQTVLQNVSKEDIENHYGLSSVDEFISEAYSNPQFQAFLKSVQLQKSKTASRKTIDLLLSVVTLNARVISKEIPEKTAFEAFQNIDLDSLDLLEDFEKNIHSTITASGVENETNHSEEFDELREINMLPVEIAEKLLRLKSLHEEERALKKRTVDFYADKDMLAQLTDRNQDKIAEEGKSFDAWTQEQLRISNEEFSLWEELRPIVAKQPDDVIREYNAFLRRRTQKINEEK